MPRDYAKYKTVKRSPKKNWRRIGNIFAAVITLSVVCGGYGVYRYHHSSVANTQAASTVSTTWSELTAKFHHKKAPALALIKNKPVEPEEGVHFNFYTELPNMQVTAAALDEGAEIKPAIKVALKDDQPADQDPVSNSVKTLQFVLQMGVFSDVNTASQSRLSLLLGGFDSEVIKITENGKSMYIVQQGPFLNANQAKAAQKKLMSKGVESTLKKAYL